MKSYLAYVRVSTARQSEQGTSPQEQRHAITGYALREGLDISGWYEESESAARQGRPEFSRMLRDLKRRRSAGIIMHKIDRGARNLRDWAVLLDLSDSGVEVHFVHDHVDLTSRGGRLTANIQAVMAADYSRNLSEEVKKGQLGRLRQGLYPLRAPRGYVDRGKGKVKEIHPVDGALVREAFELYATGDFTLDTLRLEMASRGLRQPRGAAISLAATGKMLRNPFYTGLMRVSTIPETFAGTHQALVPQAVFDRVQDVLDGKKAAKVQKHDFLLRRRVRCGTCERLLTPERQKGYVYYRCHGTACARTSVREEAIIETIVEQLTYLYVEGEELGDFRDVLDELIAKERAGEKARQLSLNREIAVLDDRLSRLTDELLSDVVDRATYLAKKEELLRARRALEEEQEGGMREPFWEGIRQTFERGFVALPHYISGEDPEKREIVDSLSSNLAVAGKEPVLTLVSPLQEWADLRKQTECALSRTRLRTFLARLTVPKPKADQKTGS